MKYNYFNHHRFIYFRKNLGYRILKPAIYLAPYKHQRLIDNTGIFQRFTHNLPEIYIEHDLNDLNENELIGFIEQTKNFYVQGFSFQKIPWLDNFNSKELGTFIIDLKPTLEKIWDSFDYSLQKQLKKVGRIDLRVTRAKNLEDLKKYYSLLKKFRSRLGFWTHSWHILVKQWELLHKEEESNYEVFLCFDKTNKLLAGMGIIINPTTRQVIEVAVARSGKTQNIPALDSIRWEIIKFSKEANLEYYDLAGANPHTPPGSKEENIYRNKKKWGGIFYHFYHYEKYFLKNRWYYSIAYKILKWMSFIKK